MMDVMLIRRKLMNDGNLVVPRVRLSHFVPCRENGLITERAFVQANAAVIERPFAYLGVLPETGELLYYKHCGFEDFVDTAEYPFGMDIDGSFATERDVDSHIAMERDLLDVYGFVREYAFTQSLGEHQKEALDKFNGLFAQAVPKGLLPFYRALSPAFFAWIENGLR